MLTATPVEPLVLPTEHRLASDSGGEARRSHSAATLCVTAVLALVGMLLVRHVLLGVHALGMGGACCLTEHGVVRDTFGSLCTVYKWLWLTAASPTTVGSGSDVLDYLGITILLAWLFVRLLVLALPMVVVMHAIAGGEAAPRPPQTEDGHVLLLLSLEAGLYSRGGGH